MSKETGIKQMEEVIKEGEELEDQSALIAVDIPDEFVKIIHVDATSFDNASVATQLEKAMNEAIFEEPMYSVKSINTIYSDALSATVSILFERKF